MKTFIIFLCFTLMVFSVQSQNEHPLISKYEGSVLLEAHVEAFMTYTLATGPAERDGFTKKETLDAKVHFQIYQAPAGKAIEEVWKNYILALQGAGFQVLFKCQGDQCRSGTYSNWAVLLFGNNAYNTNQIEKKSGLSKNASYIYSADRYLSAVKQNGNQKIYIALSMVQLKDRVLYFLDVIEPASLEAGKVTINLEYLQNEFKNNGKVVLYEFPFETNSAALLPESLNLIATIYDYLKGQTGNVYYVVGHTDDTGLFDRNMQLSKERAASVANELMKKGIKQTMIVPHGAGPLCPVGDNRTEGGRALNRRVEIIQKLDSSTGIKR